MEVIVAKKSKKEEHVVALRTLKPGESFRDAQVSFEEAVAEKLFFMVTPELVKNKDLVLVLNQHVPEFRKFGPDYKVIKHKIVPEVHRNV